MDSIPRTSTHSLPEMTPAGNSRSVDRNKRQRGNRTTALPPKRVLPDPLIREAIAEEGLRIGSNPARCEEGSPKRQEVKKHNKSIVRLKHGSASSKKIVRLTVFLDSPASETASKISRGEGQGWGLSKQHSARWLVGAGVAVTALVIGVMTLLPSINAPNAPRAHTAKKQLAAENETKVESATMLNQLLGKQPQAMQIFRTYSHAAHLDEILPLIRNGEALKETLRSHWRPLGVPSQWTFDAEPTWTVFEAAGHACGLLQGIFPDQSKFAAYFTNDDHRLELDWKATTTFGTASFEQLAKNEGDGSEIRGKISAADFYSATWPETEYQSYRLVSPDEKTVIWCYARRGQAAEAIVSSLFQEGEIVQEAESARSVALRLERATSDALPNQWLIGQVLQVDAITP